MGATARGLTVLALLLSGWGPARWGGPSCAVDPRPAGPLVVGSRPAGPGSAVPSPATPPPADPRRDDEAPGGTRAAAPTARVEAPPPEQPSLGAESDAECEFFVLVDPARLGAEPLGVLRHVRLAREGVDWQVEQELLLHGPEARHHLVERYQGDEAQLVFREQARPGARTIRAHWPLSGATPPLSGPERLREWEPAVVQWYGTRRTERRFPGARGWQGPLGLVERLRWELEHRERLPRLEVLSGLPERVHLGRARLAGVLPVPLRLVTLAGDDGAVRGAYLFLGAELLAVAWQGGGPVALRTSRERYEGLAARHPLVRRVGGPEAESEAGVDASEPLQIRAVRSVSTVGVGTAGG